MEIHGIHIFDFMFQLNAPFVYYIYQLPLHVSSNIVLIIRRINCIHTASGSLYVTISHPSAPLQEEISHVLAPVAL